MARNFAHASDDMVTTTAFQMGLTARTLMVLIRRVDDQTQNNGICGQFFDGSEEFGMVSLFVAGNWLHLGQNTRKVNKGDSNELIGSGGVRYSF